MMLATTPFAETPTRKMELSAALQTATPLQGSLQSEVWLSALAALSPRHTATELLGVWPLTGNGTAAGWWHLLTNLGYTILPSGNTETIQTKAYCWLRADGDIWISHNAHNIWKARSAAMVDVKTLPQGDWLTLELPSKPVTNTFELGDILFTTLRPLFPSLFFSSLLIQIMGVLVPVFIMVVYNHVIDGRAQVGYTGLLVGLAAVLMTEATLRRIRGHMLVRAGLRAETLWVNRITAQLIHLPAALVERASLSSQISRLRGVDIFRDMATSPIVLGLLDVPFIAVTLLTLYLISGSLVLIPLTLIGSYIVFMLLCLPWVKNTLRRQATVSEQQQALVLEASQHRLALRADGLTDHWLERMEANGKRAMRTTTRSTFMQHALEVTSLFCSSMAGLLTLYVGMGMMQSGTLSAGGLVASMMLVWRMLAPLSLLCTALPRLVQLFQTALQVSEFLNITPETPTQAQPAPTQLAHPTPKGEVTLHTISLRYMREHAQVLGNLTATVEAGQLTVIMGGNGSGKSTLLKVIAGLYPLQGGAIRLDGIDIRQWDPERLRSHIAYLPQQPDIFTDTVAANLRLANPLATDSELWHALEQAGAAETVRQMNLGLSQPVEETEVPELLPHQLSLARLYLHPGALVLCDELPALLNNRPEAATFHDWLIHQRGHRTVITVGSHPQLVRLASLGIGLLPEGNNLTGPASQVQARLRSATAQAAKETQAPSLETLPFNERNLYAA